MRILETSRLALRQVQIDDAEFILQLLNEPAWLQFIGDRGVRTIDDARSYILKGPIEMYARLGFGLYLVELKDGSIPIGLCGLLKREFLDDADIGFAFLQQQWKKGYAYEAAFAMTAYAAGTLKMKRLAAITSLDNDRSIILLEKLGFKFERIMNYPGTEDNVRLFARELN